MFRKFDKALKEELLVFYFLKRVVKKIVFLKIVKNSFSLAQHFKRCGCLGFNSISFEMGLFVENYCF